jgi:hypothetical protein
MSGLGEKIDILSAESATLNADTLALQTLLFSLMIALHRSGTVPPRVFSNTFEVASQYLSALAVRVDGKDIKTVSGEPQTLAALRIIEDFRTEFETSRSTLKA